MKKSKDSKTSLYHSETHDNFLEKKLGGKIQFTTSSPDVEAFKKRIQAILELNLPKDSFYIRWSDE